MYIPFVHRQSYRHLNTICLSKQALRSNHDALQQAHPEAVVSPVLKSNAYGHGLREIATLFDDMKCQFLIVDSLYEAYELYKAHIRTPILILGYTDPKNFTAKRIPFEITVFDLETARVLNRTQPGIRIHIFVDTGMHREGVSLEDFPSFVQELKKLTNLCIVGLCSHFADADNPDSMEMTRKQITVFKKALKIMQHEGIDPKWRHISASAGAYNVADPLFTLIRGGLAHYGISPLHSTDPHAHVLSLQPVLEFHSTLAQIKTIKEGDCVGYNCTYTAKKKMTIGLLPAGYYEGVDRGLSNSGVVTIRGISCPIIGRVSMNMTVIDLDALPHPQVGETVVVYSATPQDENSVQAVAARVGKIPYEVLTVDLAESVKRVIVP